MKTVHKLKTVQPFFDAIRSGKKTFEVRLYDRDFKVGDFLALQEYDPKTQEYSGEVVYKEITYILNNNKYCKDGFVILGIKEY